MLHVFVDRQGSGDRQGGGSSCDIIITDADHGSGDMLRDLVKNKVSTFLFCLVRIKFTNTKTKRKQGFLWLHIDFFMKVCLSSSSRIMFKEP